MVETINHLTSNLADNLELYEMSKEEGDVDAIAAIESDAQPLREQVEQLEFRRMFNNPADPSNCFIDIQAGAGGTEACDWASMLLRQYLKYCERKGFKAEVMEETEGDVAGIRSATIKVEGDYAFGHLRTETGVHRLGLCAAAPHKKPTESMEAERINALGTLIDDLRARTDALRGYL